ncbi:hypothetical protein ACWD01_29450 [Streptomyces sp. NPDC002835]
MSEPEQPPPATSESPAPEAEVAPEPRPAEPIPATPDHVLTVQPAPRPGPRWARLSRSTVLLLGVGIGAAVVGAGWLTTLLLGSGTDEAADVAAAPSVLAEETTAGPEPFMTDGSITLPSVGAGLDNDALCSGTGGYSDIDLGTQVNITDATGTLVAHGSLGPGEKTEAGCQFSFTINDITPGSKFYTVEVSHRGGLTQTEDELRMGGLAFTLGD